MFDTLACQGDHYMLLADYAAYVASQEQAGNCTAIHRLGCTSPFSMSRALAAFRRIAPSANTPKPSGR